MKENKNLARAMALLVLAQNGRDAGTETCPSPEDIAAMADGLLSWERRHTVARHVAVCQECYRIWLEVACSANGPPFVLRRPSWSFRTLVYAGGALMVVVCLAVFLYLHRPQHEIVSLQQSTSPAIMNNKESQRNQSTPEEPYAPPVLRDGGGVPSTVDDVAKSDGVVLNAGGADARRQTVNAEANKMAAGEAAVANGTEGHEQAAAGVANAQKKAEFETEQLAAKQNGSIRIGAVEVRRSADQLIVWYNDLREMCRLPHFLPDQWNSLHVRGADILKALSETGQEEEIDRLWLMLGQMEGLTAERRETFCVWSDKELARKWEKERDKTKRR